MKHLALPLWLAAGAFCVFPFGVCAQESFQQAVKAYNAKDYRTACSDFEALLKKKPDDVNVLYYDALCWYQMRNSEKAQQLYKRIIQLAPKSAAAGLARTALNSLTASTYVAPAPQSPALKNLLTSAVSSASQYQSANTNSSSADDMKSLPDTANFYFTKEPNGHMAVNLMVNGHPISAWFDTGASAYFFKDQLIADGVDCNNAQPAGYAQGWAGKPVPIYSMPAEVKLGTLTRKINIMMEASGSSFGRNLIGQSLISGYQYEIDDKGGRVYLRKTIANTEQRQDSMYDIPCTLRDSKDVIKIEINGRTIDAFIDTGSTCTIIAPQVADSLGIETTGTQQLTGVGGDLTVRIGTAKIRLGPIYKEFTVRIGGSGGTCIGQDLMEGWRFKIDREHKLLRFFH